MDYKNIQQYTNLSEKTSEINYTVRESDQASDLNNLLRNVGRFFSFEDINAEIKEGFDDYNVDYERSIRANEVTNNFHSFGSQFEKFEEYTRIVSKIMNTNVKLNMINQVYFKYFQRVLNESSVTMMPKLKPEQENITNSSNLNTNFNTTSNLKVRIPKDIPRHFGGGGLNLNEDSDNSSKFFLNSKRKRLMKKVTQCPHKDARHYAKNMCSNCYHSRGRDKKAWKCTHNDRIHYALGVCQNCYQANYTKVKKSFDDDNSQEEVVVSEECV